MRRIPLVAALVSFALLAMALGGRWSTGTAAQDATPMAQDDHPLVGAWLLDTDTEDAENPPTLATFSSDGIYTQHDPDGLDGVGSWEATGDTTANMTFVGQFLLDEEGTVGSTTVRAEIVVSDDGNSFTATYSVQFAGDGMPEDEFGPGTGEAERIAVEEMSTDLTPLDEAFGEGGDGEGAGEAGADAGDAAATPEA